MINSLISKGESHVQFLKIMYIYSYILSKYACEKLLAWCGMKTKYRLLIFGVMVQQDFLIILKLHYAFEFFTEHRTVSRSP